MLNCCRQFIVQEFETEFLIDSSEPHPQESLLCFMKVVACGQGQVLLLSSVGIHDRVQTIMHLLSDKTPIHREITTFSEKSSFSTNAVQCRDVLFLSGFLLFAGPSDNRLSWNSENFSRSFGRSEGLTFNIGILWCEFTWELWTPTFHTWKPKLTLFLWCISEANVSFCLFFFPSRQALLNCKKILRHNARDPSKSLQNES